MALSIRVCHPPQFPLKVDFSQQIVRSERFIVKNQTSFQIRSNGIGVSGQPLASVESEESSGWTFRRRTRIIKRPELTQSVRRRRSSRVYASWLTNSQIASSVFSVGTVAVLPLYTLMVVAPKTELSRKAVESSIPYILLGVLYAYLLYLSWTPETFRLIFASQYWLPELPGIAKMFSSEMTLASAWIHLLAVDLYAARQVFLDGLENEVDTRLSVSFCLLFCPIGIVAHYITKALTGRARSTGHRVH